MKDNWSKAEGPICPECGQETLRLIDGICPRCHNRKIAERDQKMEEKKERRYYQDRLRKGDISLSDLQEGR